MTRLLTLALVIFSISLLKADDAPPLPIKVTFRESLLIKGTFVDQLRNEGDQNLLVTVKLERADNSASKTLQLLIHANGMKEIGHHQGWVARSKDIITITAEGFQQMQCHIP